MHRAAMEFVATNRPETPGDVLDIGGRDINGSPRSLLRDAETYIAVDLYEGIGVDLIGDITELGLIDFADTVLCLEVLEHAENWRDIVQAAADACRQSGTVIITCAGPGRPPHSAHDGHSLRDDEHYANISSHELRLAMDMAGLVNVNSRSNGEDTQATGRKP